MLWSLYRQCRHKLFLCSLSSIVQHQYQMSLVSTIWWALYQQSGFRWKDGLFIRYSKCSTQICIDSVDNPNANIALNALHALIFISTVLTNKIPYLYRQCRQSGFRWKDGLFIRYSKCSTQICIDSVDNPNANIALNALHALIFISTVLTNKIPYLYRQCRQSGFRWKDGLFIRYSKCSTQICIDSVNNPNANIALNALHALIFILTVLTNKIPYSFELQCRS